MHSIQRYICLCISPQAQNNHNHITLHNIKYSEQIKEAGHTCLNLLLKHTLINKSLKLNNSPQNEILITSHYKETIYIKQSNPLEFFFHVIPFICMINSLKKLLWLLLWSLAHITTGATAVAKFLLAGKHCLSELLQISIILHCVILWTTRWRGINSAMPWPNCILQIIQWNISFQCSYNLQRKS